MAIEKSSSSQNTEIKQLKSNFSKREAELEAIHGTEMKRLTKQHEIEIEQVNSRAKNEIDETREKVKSRLSDQDIKHQQEIESIKALYQKKLAEKNS